MDKEVFKRQFDAMHKDNRVIYSAPGKEVWLLSVDGKSERSKSVWGPLGVKYGSVLSADAPHISGPVSFLGYTLEKFDGKPSLLVQKVKHLLPGEPSDYSLAWDSENLLRLQNWANGQGLEVMIESSKIAEPDLDTGYLNDSRRTLEEKYDSLAKAHGMELRGLYWR